MNLLVKIGAGLFAVFLFFSMVGQCTKRSEPVRTSIPSAPVQAEPAKPASTDMIMREYARGLDLKAVSELAKKAKDGADFERLLNDSTEAVNNLDLNDDNKVDYIKVTEFGSGNRRGFSLTTEVEPGKVQEIATIEFSKESEQKAVVQTTGNPSMYGPGYNHHSSFGLTDALLLGWMFSNRPTYVSPYGAGSYPPDYSGWNRRPSDQYSGDMSRRTAGSSFERSSASSIGTPLASPNAEKTAARAKAIANPTQSQRSFTTRSAEGRPAGSGGFGRPSGSGSGSSTSTSRPSSSSSGTSTSRPSSGGFGNSSSSTKSSSSAGSSSRSSSSSSSSGFGRSSSSGSSRSGGSGGGGK